MTLPEHSHNCNACEDFNNTAVHKELEFCTLAGKSNPYVVKQLDSLELYEMNQVRTNLSQ
jgi:hypothetical protein